MHIDKYKFEKGYKVPGGEIYPDAESFIQEYILGFCLCGDPESSLEYVRDVLAHIDNLKQKVWTKEWEFSKWKEKGREIFPNSGAEYFAYYVLAEKGLNEHGGAVPGWLSVKGRELLEDLVEYFNNLENESSN